ncbi:MAG: hypothetical protein WA982_17625 [Rubrobacteraceae bacterium]
MEETSGIGFKEAAAIARKFVLDLYGDGQEPKLQNVLLEEIEYDRRKNSWLVTIGFDRPFVRPSPPASLSSTLSAIQGPQYRRALKRVEIDDSSGKVLRMIEREVED